MITLYEQKGSKLTIQEADENFKYLSGQTVSKLDRSEFSGHTHTFSSLSGLPTTLSGYGITDAYTATQVNNIISGVTANTAFRKVIPNSSYSVGTLLGYDGANYVRPIASDLNNAEVLGIVSRIISPSRVELTLYGLIDTTGWGLSANTAYFLSTTTAGGYTTDDPIDFSGNTGMVRKLVFVTIEPNQAFFHNEPAEIIYSGGTGSTGGGGIVYQAGEGIAISGDTIRSKYIPADSDNDLGYFAGLLDESEEASVKQAIDRIVSYSNRYVRLGNNRVVDRWAKLQNFFGSDIPGDNTVYPVLQFFFHDPTLKAQRVKMIYTGTGSDQAAHGTDGKVIVYIPVQAENEQDAFVEVTVDGRRLVYENDVETLDRVIGEDTVSWEYWKVELYVDSLYSFTMVSDWSNTAGLFNLIIEKHSQAVDRFTDQRIGGKKTFLDTIQLEGTFPVFKKVAYFDETFEEQYLPTEFYIDVVDLQFTGTYPAPAVVRFGGGGANWNLSMYYGENAEYSAGFGWGIGSSLDKGSFIGTRCIMPLYGKPDGSKALDWFMPEFGGNDVGLYTTSASSQRLATIPLLGTGELTDIPVTWICEQYVFYKRRVYWNGAVTFDFREPTEFHEAEFAVRTGPSGATLTLPPFSYLVDGQSLTLSANSFYQVVVKCVKINEALVYKFSITKHSVNNAGSIPAAPSIRKLVALKNSINVNITPMAGATSYRVDVATDSGFTSILPAYNNYLVNSTPGSLNVDELTADTMYYVRARAVNGSGTSANGATSNIKTLAFDT